MLYGLTALFCIVVTVAVFQVAKHIRGKETRQCTLCGNFRHRTAFSGKHRRFSNPPASWCNRCLRKYYWSFTPGTAIAPKKLLERRVNHKRLLSYAGMSLIFLTFSVVISELPSDSVVPSESSSDSIVLSELSSENPLDQITAAFSAFIALLVCVIIVLNTYAVLVERNNAGDTSPLLWALGATVFSLISVAIANLFLVVFTGLYNPV